MVARFVHLIRAHARGVDGDRFPRRLHLAAAGAVGGGCRRVVERLRKNCTCVHRVARHCTMGGGAPSARRGRAGVRAATSCGANAAAGKQMGNCREHPPSCIPASPGPPNFHMSSSRAIVLVSIVFSWKQFFFSFDFCRAICAD